MSTAEPKTVVDLRGWKTDLVADLEGVALRNRWGLALMAVGWVHLGVFLVCQFLYSNGDRSSLHFLPLWAFEFAANLVVLRKVAGRGWIRSTPLIVVIARVWATFLILSFNAASMNTLTGFAVEWFKPSWTTLSTFGFAITAYLVNLWFFVPAVQMYFTGLIMVRFPDWQYLIYGISWWAALQIVGGVLERKRRQSLGNRFGAPRREDRAAEEALAYEA